MEMTEKDYAQAFGVELPAEPETEETLQNEPAEPETAEPETEPETVTEEPAEEPAAREQDAQERHRQAYGRRAREREAERNAMTAAAQERVDAVYAELFGQQQNPYTGQPIRTEADYRAYKEARDQQEREQQMREAGLDPAALQGMVDNAVKPLREQLEQQDLQRMTAEARAAEESAMNTIRSGVEAVRTRYDSSVSSLEDIVAMPTGAAFNDYVQKGLSIEDAFYMANRDAIDQRRMEAARQAGIKQASGKRHLAAVPAASGEAPYTASAKEKAAYREMLPEATDEEINAAYAAYHKNNS